MQATPHNPQQQVTPFSSYLIFFNTRDKVGNGENYAASWDLSLPRLQLLKGYRISFKHAQIPNSVYPINQYNNCFYFTYDGTPLKVVVPENNYDGFELATALQVVIDIAGKLLQPANDWTVTYDEQAAKMTISVTGAQTFVVNDGDNSLSDALGFDTDNQSSNTFQVGAYPIRISGTSYVDMVCNLSTHNHSTSSTSNILMRIPLTQPFGEECFYESSTDDYLYITNDQLNEVTIQLRDDCSKLWLLPPNHHFSFALKVSPVVARQPRRLP